MKIIILLMVLLLVGCTPYGGEPVDEATLEILTEELEEPLEIDENYVKHNISEIHYAGRILNKDGSELTSEKNMTLQIYYNNSLVYEKLLENGIKKMTTEYGDEVYGFDLWLDISYLEFNKNYSMCTSINDDEIKPCTTLEVVGSVVNT